MDSHNSDLQVISWSSSEETGSSFLRLMSLILSDTDLIVFSTILRSPILNGCSRVAVDETYIIEFTHLPSRVIYISLGRLKASSFVQYKRTNNGAVYYISENDIVSKLRAFCHKEHDYNTKHSVTCDLTCSCGETFDIFNHTDMDMKCKKCDKIYNAECDPKLNVIKDLRVLSREAFASHGPFFKYESEEISFLKWPPNTPIIFHHCSSSSTSSKRSRDEASNLDQAKLIKRVDSENGQSSDSKETHESSCNPIFDGFITQEKLESMSGKDANEYMYKLMNA